MSPTHRPMCKLILIIFLNCSNALLYEFGLGPYFLKCQIFYQFLRNIETSPNNPVNMQFICYIKVQCWAVDIEQNNLTNHTFALLFHHKKLFFSSRWCSVSNWLTINAAFPIFSGPTTVLQLSHICPANERRALAKQKWEYAEQPHYHTLGRYVGIYYGNNKQYSRD